MPATQLFTLGAVNLDSTTIDQVDNSSIDPGIEEILEGGDGSLLDSFIAAGTIMPVIDFTTKKIAVALGEVGFEGAAIGTSLDAYLQQAANAGSRASGSAHCKFTVTKGLVIPTTLTLPSAEQKSSGTLGLQCHAFSSDGTTAPLSMAIDQAYSLGSDVDEVFIAGPCSVNGTDLDGTGGITFEFGVEIDKVVVDGELYPTYIWVPRIRTQIRVDILDIELFKSSGGLITPAGVAQAATDSVLYGRKVAEGGTRVSDITAEHLKFTLASGRFKFGVINAPHGSRATAQLLFTPTDNGTDDYIGINTASGIS